MKIIMEYESHHDWETREQIYLIRIGCQKENGSSFYPFKQMDQFCGKGSYYMNIQHLWDELFYQNNSIEYIKRLNNDDEEIIIPIGLIDFTSQNDDTLKLMCHEKKDLYKVNGIIESIEKAIKIKYEAIKFKEKCDNKQTEEVILD